MKKVSFNKKTQVLRLYNHDVWYHLLLKPVKMVPLVITGSVQDSTDKKTEKSTESVKEELKKKYSALQDRTLFEPELFNEDVDAGSV